MNQPLSSLPDSAGAAAPPERLAEVVNGANDILRAALASLRTRCSVDGRLDAARLDALQVPTYDIAVAFAELNAAQALVETLVRQPAAARDPLQVGLAGVAVANALATVRSRLLARQELGLDVDALLRATTHTDVGAAIEPAGMIALAAQLRARGGDLGHDHLGDDHRMMRASFREFGEREVAPLADAIHREDRDIPDSIIDGLRQLGCFGLSVPERFGGLLPDDREDSLGMLVVTEELSRISLGAAGSLITRPEIVARAVLEGGTDAQKAHWLPQLAAGTPLCAVSITEPDTGSDVASVSLRATPVTGGWRLDGAKTWCTFAGRAGVLLVLARTENDPGLGHKGLSLFLVEKPSHAGHAFEVRQSDGGTMSGRAIATLGYRGMHSFEMVYDGFFVPDANLIGGEQGRGRGFYYTMGGFAGGRIQTAARACGLMRAAFEAALRYAEDRRVFGRAVADYGLSAAKLVTMAAQILAGQQATYAVGRLVDAGGGQMEASLVKLHTCRAAEAVTREAMQLHGGMGYAEETPVSRYWADARVLSIFEGAEETLALKVVGRSLLTGAQA